MEIEIKHHAQYPTPDPKRLGQQDTLVIYTVDGKNPNTIVLPGAVDDVKAIQAAITAKEKARGTVKGHKFTL